MEFDALSEIYDVLKPRFETARWHCRPDTLDFVKRIKPGTDRDKNIYVAVCHDEITITNNLAVTIHTIAYNEPDFIDAIDSFIALVAYYAS